MRAFVRRAVAVTSLVGVAATASACSAGHHTATAAITAQAAVREYHAEADRLVLAPRWSWPTSVSFPTAGPDGAPMLYQEGFGTTRADRYWYCSWESRLVHAAVGSAARARATREVRAVRQTHMYVEDVLAVDRPRFNRVLDTALAGDPRMMRRDVALNCATDPGEAVDSS